MPELPEVHTTVEGLKGVIVGKTIKSVWSDFYVGARYNSGQNIKNKKYFENFKKIVTDTKIKNVERRGKNILINLNNDYTIIVHMKMTGCLMYKKDYSDEKYIHLIFTLSNNHFLLLSDMRKFASVTISKTNEIHLHQTVGKLGPDPLDPKLNAQKLFEILHDKKRTPIKTALLDQNALAGIGNIYSDEILWLTAIHPLSRADKIPQNKFGKIFKAMQQILRFSIKHGGDSKSDYRNAFGEKGGFQNFHKVYSNKGQKCSKTNCSGIIERTVIGGRSTHFCPKHQIKYK
ncbi:MAG: bifunctional DNA-formamidopyrimidine glycosylase/DNA-(apurinic or apyrimidinic site) lyase [Candidatus Paceibacterota bacterium]|jgi:formamidopyrimidine-DNA glycosylase